MSQDYFYFISGLPNLSFEDSKLSYTPEQFRAEARVQLSPADYNCLEIMHLGTELDNCLGVLYQTGREISPQSLYQQDFWEEYLALLKARLENQMLQLPAVYNQLPGFIPVLLSKVLAQEERQSFAKTEHELLVELYAWTAKHKCEFIRAWFAYDAHLRNILAAINGRKYNLPYAQYLIGNDDRVDKLGKSHAADFGLGKEDPLFESLIRIHDQNNILYRERGYDILRWKWIEEQNFFNYFNINRVLGYYTKLRILSRWLKADPNVGKEVFHDTLNTMENSFTFPEEFNIKSVIK